MSYIDDQDCSSGRLTAATIALGVITFPLACILALDAFIVPPLGGTSIVARAIFASGPIYVAICLGGVRNANRNGNYTQALKLLLMLAVPTLGFIGFVLWVIVAS